MASEKINFKDIDYRGLKTSIIEFLRSSDAFKDANFEGTFINHLLSLFSYTGAIFGNYVNSIANESNIVTCNLYETGNMLGHLVGYKAHGFRGSTVSVTVTPDFEDMGLEPENISNYVGWSAPLPRNLRFGTRTNNQKNKSLIFTNITDTLLTIKEPSQETLDPNIVSLELVQGIPLSIDFVSNGKALQSFEIPNPFIDWKNIRVYVLNENSTEELWESALTWFYSGPTSKVYIPFINPRGLLEIMFAEGNFGKIPESGRTIRIEYLATSGADGQIDANMIDSLIDTIYFVNPDNSLDKIRASFTVTQSNASSEGSNIETLDRIKSFAPLYFGIQNRLVNEFDYKWYVLGEYPFVVDANAFNYQGAVEVGLLPSPCENQVVNPRWAAYILQTVAGYVEQKKIPTSWDFRSFYENYTIEATDELPVSPYEGETVKGSDILNYGTTSALYVDTSRPCEDDRGALISQRVTIIGNETCCTTVHFEVEVLNPNRDPATGEFPPITKNDIEVYINGEKCFTRIDPFTYNSSGYVQNECCCDRLGDVRGWYTVKGVCLLSNDQVDAESGVAQLLASIFIKPNKQLVLGEAKVYPESCFNANDVFVVAVPENAGYLNIETKETMLEDMDAIKMVTVRNHILAPIYQTFDVRIVFKRDESSVLTVADVSNSIRSEIVSFFIPSNRKLGDVINSIDIANTINQIAGVERAKVTVTPRSPEVLARATELQDYQLTAAEFPILGKIVFNG